MTGSDRFGHDFGEAYWLGKLRCQCGHTIDVSDVEFDEAVDLWNGHVEEAHR